MNASKAARLGLGTVTHFYGHFESLLKDYDVQPYPVDQNYNDEQDRFGQVARLWDKIYPARQSRVEGVPEEHLKLGTYVRSDVHDLLGRPRRDAVPHRRVARRVHAAARCGISTSPTRDNHGAYWYDWTTEDEVAWRTSTRCGSSS